MMVLDRMRARGLRNRQREAAGAREGGRDGELGRHRMTQADLSRPSSVSLVNHAYIALNDAPISKMTLEQWQKTIGINLTGPASSPPSELPSGTAAG